MKHEAHGEKPSVVQSKHQALRDLNEGLQCYGNQEQGYTHKSIQSQDCPDAYFPPHLAFIFPVLLWLVRDRTADAAGAR